MKTAKRTDCKGDHGHTQCWGVATINGRRYTQCQHTVGHTYCGQLIDVTDGAVVICCGEHQDAVGGRNG